MNHDRAQKLHNNLGVVLHMREDYDGAEEPLREALAIRRKVLANGHPHLIDTLYSLASNALQRKDSDRALKLYREALAIQRKSLGDTHPQVAVGLGGLLDLLLTTKDYPGAEAVGREFLGHGRSHGLLAVLGRCLLEQGKHAAAEPFLRECLALRTKSAPPGHWLVFNAMSMLGEALAGQKKYADAEPLLVEGYERMKPPEQATHRKREALERVVKLYEDWDRPEKAAEWRKRLGQ